MSTFTHLDGSGHARMVDVTRKSSTMRRAVARSLLSMKPETVAYLKGDEFGTPELLESARIAGVLAAKRTSQLIPLCHPLPVAPLEFDFAFVSSGVSITGTAHTYERTGVEMEALVGCSVAALTLYDLCRERDRTMTIEDTALWEKTGGKSGPWVRRP